MKTGYKYLKYLLFIIIFFGSLYLFLPSDNYEVCRLQELFRKSAIKGVVVNKYYDKTQHSVPVIEVLDSTKTSTKHTIYRETSGLWSKIQVNDSIKKNEGDANVYVKRDDRYILLVTATFDCNLEDISPRQLRRIKEDYDRYKK
jgi:hypothetical protein